MTVDTSNVQALNGLLLNAVRTRRLRDAERALEAGAEADATDGFGISALHLAAVGGDSRMISLLVRHGGDAHGCGKSGLSPFDWAVLNHRLEAMQALSLHCTDLDPEGPDRTSPLEIAFLSSHPETARWLIDHGADIEQRDRFGDTLLVRMARAGNDVAVQMLLQAGCRSGRRAFLAAMESGSSATQTLLRADCAAAYRWGLSLCDENEASSVIRVVDGSAATSAKSVLSRTQRLRHRWAHGLFRVFATRHRLGHAWRRFSGVGDIALQQRACRLFFDAIRHREYQAARYAIERGEVSADARDGQGCPALLVAARAAIGLRDARHGEHQDRRAVLDLMIELARSATHVHARCPMTGNTVLHEAVQGADAELTLQLLRLQPIRTLVNVSNRALDRAIHLAVGTNAVAVIDALIGAGADANPVNRRGHTPLHLCAMVLDLDTAARLMVHGASPYLRTRAGHRFEDLLGRRHDQDQAMELLALLEARRAIDLAKTIFSSGNPMADVVRARHQRLAVRGS